MTTAPGLPAAATPKGFKAKAKANPQLVVGAGAVALVVVLALVSKNKATPTDPGANPTSTGIASGQGAGYDSTANDVYQSLSGQMQGLQDQITGIGATATTPTPLPNEPAPSAATAGVVPGFYRPAGAAAVYQIDAAGNRDWITAPEYAAMGSPKFTDIAQDNVLWSTGKVVGTDASLAQRTSYTK